MHFERACEGEQERTLDLLRALAVGQREHVMGCLMDAHAMGSFRHRAEVDAASWQEWWAHVMAKSE